MYLWEMVIDNEKVDFKFTENTAEKRSKAISNSDFKADKSYTRDNQAIKPMVEACIKMCNALKIDLTEKPVIIECGFVKFMFIYQCIIFYAYLRNGSIVIETSNSKTFTREQFNAIFDFLDVVKESNWFY